MTLSPPSVAPAEAAAIVRARPLDLPVVVVLLLAHVLAAWALVHIVVVGVAWQSLALGFVWFVACGLAITAGYHRLFAHRAYRASAPLRALLLLFGTASAQNSALNWCIDHRRHHAGTDTVRDPYSVRHGFWWAHMGWVLRRGPGREIDRHRDLAADRLVRLQDRFYVPLAILMGAVVPLGLGFLWGDPLGALLVAGFLRLVVQWHATFAVNSFAHRFGTRPFDPESTARDSGWIALFTLGEGYHNFHHRFPADYRNGIRWHDFDPTKWFVWSMARLRLAHGLRRTGPERIAAARRARSGPTARAA